MQFLEPHCMRRQCEHFGGLTEGPDGVYFCAAFPEGIPKEIAFGTDKHEKPVNGDHGIQYRKYKPGGQK